MNKSLLWLLVGFVVIVGVAYFFAGRWASYNDVSSGDLPEESSENLAYQQDLGMYPYQCDNGSKFILSPLEGLQTVQVSADAQGMFTGTATLLQEQGTTYRGLAPDGQEVSLVGSGETIHLTAGEVHATCTPTPSADAAPWNWGDA